MKKLFILLSVSLFVLASCCGGPKNANDSETKATKSEECCGGCDEATAEGSCDEATAEGCCGESTKCSGNSTAVAN